MQTSQIKKWKVTLPDGEMLFLIQKEKPLYIIMPMNF